MIPKLIVGVLPIACKVQSEVYLMGTTHRIRCIRDIILVEFIISIPEQIVGDTLALVIQNIDIKVHTFGEVSRRRVFLHIFPYFFVRNIIFQAANDIRFTGSHLVRQFQLFLFYFRNILHGGTHISHILNRFRHFFTRTFSLFLTVKHRCISQPAQRTVYPTSRIPP